MVYASWGLEFNTHYDVDHNRVDQNNFYLLFGITTFNCRQHLYFSSTDNGGAPNGFQFNWGSNFPLRSAKGYFFEGGTRSVGFVWGEVFKNRKGQVSMDLMHVTDWLPTLYEAAGGDVGKLGDIDGYSMMDFLTGKSKTSPRSEVLINLNPLFNSKAIKVGQYKYLLNPYERWTEE